MATLDALLAIMGQLRDPASGCPWDIQQDMRSLLRYTLEETYEVVDAVECNDSQQIMEELGDLLFQVVFYAQIASEQNQFDMQKVIDGISTKLVTRHPHVFPTGNMLASRDLQEIHSVWEQRKADERKAKGLQGVLSDIPVALPALQRAHKIQSRLARIGFDWDNPRDVLEQLRSEIDELEQAMDSGNSAACAEELGDVLFSCVNLSRHLQQDAEDCLRASNHKVMARIAWMEKALEAKGQVISGQTLEALEALWQEAKAQQPGTETDRNRSSGLP